VFAQQDLPACPADIDTDGIVGVDDLLSLLAQFGRTNCAVPEGSQPECTDEQTAAGNVAALTAYCRASGGPLNTINNMCMSETTNSDAVGDLCE
jgi:putative hemolysin